MAFLKVYGSSFPFLIPSSPRTFWWSLRKKVPHLNGSVSSEASNEGASQSTSSIRPFVVEVESSDDSFKLCMLFLPSTSSSCSTEIFKSGPFFLDSLDAASVRHLEGRYRSSTHADQQPSVWSLSQKLVELERMHSDHSDCMYISVSNEV